MPVGGKKCLNGGEKFGLTGITGERGHNTLLSYIRARAVNVCAGRDGQNQPGTGDEAV